MTFVVGHGKFDAYPVRNNVTVLGNGSLVAVPRSDLAALRARVKDLESGVRDAARWLYSEKDECAESRMGYRLFQLLHKKLEDYCGKDN